MLDERVETRRQRRPWDPEAASEVIEPRRAEQRVTHDQQGPRIADHVERLGKRAALAPALTTAGSILVVFLPLSFVVFMAIARAGQLLGWHWRTWLPGAEGVKSLNGGVKAAVYTFMAHLT
jgi:light-harvesting complex 1 beta chain